MIPPDSQINDTTAASLSVLRLSQTHSADNISDVNEFGDDNNSEADVSDQDFNDDHCDFSNVTPMRGSNLNLCNGSVSSDHSDRSVVGKKTKRKIADVDSQDFIDSDEEESGAQTAKLAKQRAAAEKLQQKTENRLKKIHERALRLAEKNKISADKVRQREIIAAALAALPVDPHKQIRDHCMSKEMIELHDSTVPHVSVEPDPLWSVNESREELEMRNTSIVRDVAISSLRNDVNKGFLHDCSHWAHMPGAAELRTIGQSHIPMHQVDEFSVQSEKWFDLSGRLEAVF